MTEFDDSLHQSLGGHRATKGRQPGSVAATFGSFNVAAAVYPAGKIRTPWGQAGTAAGRIVKKTPIQIISRSKAK
jgi:hypothetical protein